MSRISASLISFRSFVLAGVVFICYVGLVFAGSLVYHSGLFFDQSNAQQLISLVGNIRANSQRVLILFANNAEQRFGGGFIGTIGVIENDKGQMDIQDIRSVYYYDWVNNESQYSALEVSDLLGPENFAGKGFLRSTGLYMNWPESGQFALDAMGVNTGLAFDTVLQITPDILIDILRITGPIYLEQYQLEVSAENFRSVVQLEIEAGKDKAEGQDPKTILEILTNQLTKKLFDLNINSLSRISQDIVTDQIAKKQIVGYSINPNIQKAFEDLNMTGELSDGADSYFSISELTFLPNKSAYYIDQRIKQQIRISETGEAIVDLQIEREHTSDKAGYYWDPANNFEAYLVNDNINYSEIAIPRGSKMLASNIDPDQISSHQEADRDIYQFKFDTKVLSTNQVHLRYSLPTKVQTTSDFDFELLLQRSVGQKASEYTIQVIPPQGFDLEGLVTNVQDPAYFSQADGSVVYTTTLDTDQLLRLKFNKTR